MDWPSSLMQPQAAYQPPHVAAPPPLPMPAPQVQVAENSLVEASDRAMMLRLRQLYEKDTKLFLRAQNDVNNAIFKSIIPLTVCCTDAVKVSEVWNHFTKESPTLVRCKRCPKSFQRGTYACTTPFWQHLMYSHEGVYETTNYYMKGVAVGNMRRTKLKSPNVEHSASASQAGSEPDDNQDTLDADVPDVATDDVAQVVATENAADGSPNEMEPDAVRMPSDIGASEPVATPQFPLDVMLRLQDQLMRRAMYKPTPVSLSQPIPIRVPPAQAPEDDLFVSSGRVLLLRLRQLYEKDVKMFLRAQNDISNAIFKYEVAE